MNRKQYVYQVGDDDWHYEVWYGAALSVIGRAGSKERAEHLAARV